MEHYYSQKTSVASAEKLIEFEFKNHKFKFITDRAVFSKNKVDLGTKTLLTFFNFEKSFKKVLDVGCGYGPIGIILSYFLKTEIDMIDINERGLVLTKKNIELNNVKANVFFSDKYQNVFEKYDLIITNPPIRIGKSGVLEILKKAFEYLNADGELWFVIHKNGGAKSFYKEFEKKYNIEIIGKNKGFYVFRVLSN